MKIAVTDPSLFTLPYDLALCRALRAKKDDVTLYGRKLRPLEYVTESDALQTFFYGWSERLKRGLPAGLFQTFKGFEHPVDMVRLMRHFHEDRPSIVHFQWVPIPMIDKLAVRYVRLKIAPVVLTVHDIKPFNDSPTSALQQIGSTNVWREFDHLIVHSDASRIMLSEHGFSDDQISVIPHGVLGTAATGFHMSATSDQTAHANKRLTILLFGRIKPYKGVDVMIEAMGLVPKPLLECCRVVVMGEPMIPIEPLKQRAESLGVSDSITWDLGYVSDKKMANAFAQADVFAFPYREIDTSGVLMSCLPYNKAIIASALGAFATLLQDGVHGRLVPTDDADALSRAIVDLVTNAPMREACGQNVALLSTTIPSWDVIAEQTMAVYDRLVQARRAATT